MNNQLPNFALNDKESFRICKIEEKLTPEFFGTHQHKYFEMILITQSYDKTFEHTIDFISYPIQENRIYFISPNQTHRWELKKFDKEFKGYFIVFNESFVETDEALLNLFDFLEQEPFIQLKTKEQNIAKNLIKMIETAKNENSKYTKSLLEALLYHLSDKKKSSFIVQNTKQRRFIELRKLIEKYYKKEKFISFYAKKMNLSNKRLNEIIKEVSKESITEIIHQRTILEAKRALSLRQQTIQSIAYDLGFNDPSYFSRFFKKRESISPNEFINNLYK